LDFFQAKFRIYAHFATFDQISREITPRRSPEPAS